MANYLYLTIENHEIFCWRYYIPKEDISILNFIFRPKDKLIIKDEGGNYTHIYNVSVREIKKRLKNMNLDKLSIERILNSISNIPLNKLRMAFMNIEEFYDRYNPDDNLLDEKDKYDKIIESHDFGRYPLLYYIISEIDSYSENAFLKLDLSQLYLDKKEAEEFNIISEDFYSDLKLQKRYIQSAKINFTKGYFDLVYISLIIALESSIKSYVTKKYLSIQKTEEACLDLEKMFKSLSLIVMVRFAIIFLGKQKIEESVLKSIEKIYNKRNNIIHNNMRKFNRMEAIKAIEIIEKVIAIIENLK